MKRVISIVSLVAAGALFVGAGRLWVKPTVDRLTSDQPQQRYDGLNSLIGERLNLVDALRKALSDMGPPEAGQKEDGCMAPARLMLIDALGYMRAEAAVPELLQNLVYEVKPFATDGGEWGWDYRYPAAGSLLKIGIPALEPLSKRLSKTDNPLERELCARIVDSMLGDKMAEYWITMQMDSAASEQVKARLKEALETARAHRADVRF